MNEIWSAYKRNGLKCRSLNDCLHSSRLLSFLDFFLNFLTSRKIIFEVDFVIQRNFNRLLLIESGCVLKSFAKKSAIGYQRSICKVDKVTI